MRRLPTIFLTCLLALMLSGSAEAKKEKQQPIDPALYIGQSTGDAMAALVAQARESVKAESWEKIAIGRVLLLGGHPEEGRALLAEVAAAGDASDLVRIGRAYHESGDWPAAKQAFDKVISEEPRDADWLAEVGGYYNLAGDRQRAEELFSRSFDIEPANWRNMLRAAGSYSGVRPD